MTSTSPSTSVPTSAPTTPFTETSQGQHMAPVDDLADDMAWAHNGQPELP
jgi:hypothetical protein